MIVVSSAENSPATNSPNQNSPKRPQSFSCESSSDKEQPNTSLRHTPKRIKMQRRKKSRATIIESDDDDIQEMFSDVSDANNTSDSDSDFGKMRKGKHTTDAFFYESWDIENTDLITVFEYQKEGTLPAL